MKTIIRTFTKDNKAFTVTGHFAYMNGPGEMSIEGDPSAFEAAAIDETGVPVVWERMTGEMFEGAFTRDPMGWEIRTEVMGEWGILEW